MVTVIHELKIKLRIDMIKRENVLVYVSTSLQTKDISLIKLVRSLACHEVVPLRARLF